MRHVATVLLGLLTLTLLACSSEPTQTPTPTFTPTPTPAPTPTWVLTDEYSVVIDEWTSSIEARTYLNLKYDIKWQMAAKYVRATSDEFNDVYLDMIEEHMWTVVLPYLQPIADENGFGDVWRTMSVERTAEAAADVESFIYLSGRFIPSGISDAAPTGR